MKGRRTFSANELHGIEVAVRDLSGSDPRRRRSIQETLRRHYRFYVSDFVRRGARLTADELERLIAQGVIRVYV